MALAFDVQSSDHTANAATSFSLASFVTVGSSANRAMVLLISWSSTAPTTPSFTWDSAGFTIVPSTSVVNGAAGNVALYGLIAPNSGAKTLAGSWTGARDYYVAVVAYSGVDQTSVAVAFPHGTTGSSNTATSTVTVTSATGNAAVAVHGSSGSFSAVNNTSVFLDNTAASISGAGNRAAGAATVTLTGTQTGIWASAGCDVLAASAGGGSPLRRNASLDGLGASGPFFSNPLARSVLGWRPSIVAAKRRLIVPARPELRLAA